MTSIERMRSDLVKDSLRRAFQEAVDALIVAGIDERDALAAAVHALKRLLMEVVTDEQDLAR